MKLSDYIVTFLQKKGIRHFFGYQGTMIAHLVDSIERNPETENHSGYNEQGAAFAACGYAQAKEDNSEEQKAHSQEQIASFERQLALLDDTVNPGAVKMPYDGVLWEVYTEEGAYLSPNQPVVKIYRPDSMKLSASVLSEDAAALTPGLKAKVIYADGSEGEAEVSFIAKTAEKQMSSIGLEENRCTVELKPAALPEHAGAGQTADVSFHVVTAPEVFSVPRVTSSSSSSVSYRMGKRY